MLRKIVLVIAGTFFSALALLLMRIAAGSGYAAVAIMPLAALAGIVGASFLVLVIAPAIADKFGYGVLLPSSHPRVPAARLCAVRGMIENDDLDAALAEIGKIMEKTPCSAETVTMLVEIYMDRLHDNDKALEVLEAYFASPELKPVPENIDLLMRHAEICEARGCHEKAAELLKQELNKKYCTTDLKALNARLNTLL